MRDRGFSPNLLTGRAETPPRPGLCKAAPSHVAHADTTRWAPEIRGSVNSGVGRAGFASSRLCVSPSTDSLNRSVPARQIEHRIHPDSSPVRQTALPNASTGRRYANTVLLASQSQARGSVMSSTHVTNLWREPLLGSLVQPLLCQSARTNHMSPLVSGGKDETSTSRRQRS